jgi:hypothetical protein
LFKNCQSKNGGALFIDDVGGIVIGDGNSFLSNSAD